MRYWLFKSEPETYSIDHLAKDRTTFWNGVRNYQARNLLKEAQPGDGILFYHSSAEPPGVAGLAQVAEAAKPDPTQFDKKSEQYDPDSSKDDPRWWGVTIRFERKLPRFVGLPELKGMRALSAMVLLQRSRLSVQPVTDAEWRAIVEAGTR
jgi:predicted RNA-binding protein with PUA-like domain